MRHLGHGSGRAGASREARGTISWGSLADWQNWQWQLGYRPGRWPLDLGRATRATGSAPSSERLGTRTELG